MRSSTIVFIVLCALGLVAMSRTAEAQQRAKMPRIGVLRVDSPPQRNYNEFLQGLRALGYVEGQNIALEIRWAEGQLERLPALAAELVRLPVDVIVTHGVYGVRAARDATSTIPIVMAWVGDADGYGFVASLARPGGNITGLSFQSDELSGKWLEILKEALSSLARVAVLWDPTTAVNQLKAIESFGRAVGVQLHVLEVGGPEDFDGAFAAANTARAAGLVMLASIVLSRHSKRLAELATRHQLPAIYYHRRFAEEGGLLAYGPQESDPSWGWQRAAVFVDKILKGAKPADLPVERPRRFELVINLKTAQALGLTLPSHLLALADEALR
jgi:putative ABC transport system substrate-binding protein